MQEMTKQTGIKSHTLRYWEQQIPELAAYVERHGTRRRYRTQGVATFVRVRQLLEDEGYTIKGVRATLFVRGGSGKKSNPQKMQLAQVRQTIQSIIKTLS